MSRPMTQISYDHGVSDKKLLGETIGAFFDRAVDTWRDREALVVRQQNVRWSWGELGRRVDDLAAELTPAPAHVLLAHHQRLAVAPGLDRAVEEGADGLA